MILPCRSESFWLARGGVTAQPERKLLLYHFGHRGLPLALISPYNSIAWQRECDEQGNLLNEENQYEIQLQQLLRLLG